MGCLMNLLWLLAWWYLYCCRIPHFEFIDDADHYRHSFWDANIEVGRTCFMAFR